MQLSSAPNKIVEAFAINAAPSGGYGGKRTIPVPSQTGITPGAASYNDGFPPLTMTPLPGGVVMSGLDVNGILNEATAIDWWMSAGATFQFDSVFAAAVGGYPKGARLLNAAGTGFWTSIIDNNSNNPDTGGVGWVPDRAFASVYSSAQQTLGSNLQKVNFNTVEFDAFNLWNQTAGIGGTGGFVAKWAGAYRISGAVYYPSPQPGLYASQVWKNGSQGKQSIQFPQVSSVSLSFPFDVIIYCAIGDYLEVYVNIPAGSNLVGQVGSNENLVYAQAEYLGG
jgi:hypothetical protein